MRLLYATSITLPSYRANRIQITSMARAWAALLGNDFVLGVGEADKDSLRGVPHFVTGEGIRSYTLAWRYLAYAKKNGITHIYCREEKLLFFMLAYNTLFFRLPLRFYYELHHLVYMGAWWHKAILKKVDGVISITKAMRGALLKGGYPGGTIIVAPDAVDLSRFGAPIGREAARKKLGLPPAGRIVVYTGAINEPWKGVGTLYEAARQLGNSCRVLIVGGKPHYVEHFRSQHPEPGNVSLLGHKPHDEIPLYLAAADVLVLPNSAKAEVSRVSTSPMKLFEYMASGTPIVASDLPSIREILSEENAVLVRPDDPASLAAGITRALERPDESAALALQARRSAENYTWDKRATAIADFMRL